MKLPNIVDMILEQVEMEMKDEWRPPREANSFRGSELGDCPRSLQYAIKGYERQQVGPEVGLLFRDGHLHHNDLRSLIQRTSRVTNIEHPSRRYYTLELEGAEVGFTITTTTDGIINGEYLFDIKTINFFSFKALSKEYILKNYLGYIYQLQIYLDVYDKEYGCLIFKDKMTSALKIYWYKKDPELIQKILTRIARIHKANLEDKWIKRPYTKSSKECKRCPYRQHCWGKLMERREWAKS